MLPILRTVIRRDLLLAWRRRSDVATAVLFFVIVVSLFPLGIGAEPNLLRAIAPGAEVTALVRHAFQGEQAERGE